MPTPDAQRLALKDATTLTKIPVMPISYADAQPLLASLDWCRRAAKTGVVVCRSLIALVPARGRAHLKLAFNWDQEAAVRRDRAPSRARPFRIQWVIRGNHHDAWVNGAEDPVSGMSAVLEEARALGELRRQGWSPKRTIVYCAWDGEEPALLGSTEWAETHGDDLQKHAVAYVNSDDSGRGFLQAEGSHALEHFINDVARDIQDPETHVTIWKRQAGARHRRS